VSDSPNPSPETEPSGLTSDSRTEMMSAAPGCRGAAVLR
jgi:hypothetical protein